jgi:hypothetical protein
MVNQGDIPKSPAEQPITTKAEIWYVPQGSVQYPERFFGRFGQNCSPQKRGQKKG